MTRGGYDQDGYRQVLPKPDISPPAGSKRCDGCGKVLPLEDKFWHKDGTAPDGYRNECKVCRNAKTAKDDDDAARSMIEAKQNEADEKFLEYILAMPRVKEAESIPHMTMIYERLVHYFGGADGIARHTAMVYLSGTPAIRARILSGIKELGIKVSQEGHARLPVELMETEDLQRELDKRLKLITVKSSKPGQPDAELSTEKRELPPDEPPSQAPGEGDAQS